MLVGPDNAEMTNNEVKFGTRIAIALEGVTNYELKDEKAFPGLMLSVTDKDGKFIVNEADLFADSEEGTRQRMPNCYVERLQSGRQ